MPGLTKKEWTEIVGFEGRYFISIASEVFDTKKERYIKPHLSGVLRRNYHQVTLYLKGDKFTKRVHSLMGISWLGFVYGDRKICIDHIDNNKLNNNLENLRLVSHRENSSKETINKNGFIGVRKVLNTERFIANIYINKKQVYLGTYDCPKKANEAYLLKLNEINNQINK
mgnify:CR=1 FL=1